MKNHLFRPRWAASLATAALLPLFVSLGVWQLHRADEKATLMEQRERRQTEPMLSAADGGWMVPTNRYRRIELSGQWDAAHQFLLDNQMLKQQPGYHVLTPLRLAGTDLAVLVNRGWVPAGKDRMQLPDLAIGEIKAHITGTIDQFPGVGFKLKGAEIPTPGWPAVVLLLDAGKLSERLGYRLAPYQVLLAADEPAGYVRDWKQADLHPEKSQGYALQWFSFALATAALYLWHGFKPK